jgi:hypothetical protein
MKPSQQPGRFAARFRECYLRSLQDYRFYYDDLNEIGSAADAEHVFYFVPGTNGTPGQMRFMLPSLVRVFGPRIHLKALHLPEFSAKVPMWEKYTVPHVQRKLARLQSDLAGLLERHERVTVLCSSSGFYDFAAAAGEWTSSLPLGRVHLVWGACAPDRFEHSRWEDVLYPLNGFTHEGHKWWAYPNHNLLQALNPETSCSFHWRDGGNERNFVKTDLESRFRCSGLEWCYTSVDQLGAITRHVAGKIRAPLRIPALALIAANDGYWQGRSRAEITRTIHGYLPGCHLDFRPDSHLWVVNPTNLTDVFTRLKAAFAAPAEGLQPAHRTATDPVDPLPSYNEPEAFALPSLLP